uniref:Ig-like domain-containing protein n=1 Tax=Zonotrichia albicollis TaxID=44394 RepID=A0A8D2M7U6_ZONAL
AELQQSWPRLPLPAVLTTLSLFSLGVDAQAGQAFTVQQPQAKVTVTAGETLTLICITSGVAGPGPVMWLKGWGNENKTVYDPNNRDPSSRVTVAVPGSDTNFTIHISNVQPEDMGTYYCVKFVKGSTGADEVFRRGSGTEVTPCPALGPTSTAPGLYKACEGPPSLAPPGSSPQVPCNMF